MKREILFKNKVKQIAMKDGDEIKKEVNLVAKKTDIPCIGCYFDSISGCKAIKNDKIKCWDDDGTLFIFKEIQP